MKNIKYFTVLILSILFLLALPLIHSNKAFADSALRAQTSANPATAANGVNILQAVSVYDATHAWAVGSYQDTDGIFHDLIEFSSDGGANWTAQTGANPGANNNALYGVKALSATNIWAVGAYVDADFNHRTLIEHSTDGGSTWTQDTGSDTVDGTLNAIDGDPTSGDAWAVGVAYGGTQANGDQVTMHLVSGHFVTQTNVATDTTPYVGITLNGVSERTSTDIWAVGDRYVGGTSNGQTTFTMHNDGSGWTKETSPNLYSGNEDFLTGVTAVGPNDAWAVGHSLSSANIGTLMHWNGSAWSTTPLTVSIDSALTSYLYSVTTTSSNSIWAAGSYGELGSGSLPLIWHSSDGGANWTQVSAENPGGNGYLNGITADKTTGNLWAVGAHAAYQNGNYYTNTLVEKHTPKTPLILIPGIMGSKLAVTGSQSIDPINAGYTLSTDPDSHCSTTSNYQWTYSQDELIWINENTDLYNRVDTGHKVALPCSNFLDVLQMDSSGNPTYSQIGLNGKITDTPYNNGTLPYLADQGYIPNEDLFIFPYDWRKDVSTTVSGLDALVNTATESAHAAKVDIIAHSMGGLVAREYIRDTSRAGKVHTLVELGTPHAGAPKFLAQLLYNTCTIPRPLNLLWIQNACIPNPQEANKLLQNMPGGFDLLPSKLYYTLYPSLYPYYDTYGDDNMIGSLNYDQLKDLLLSSVPTFNKNSTVFAIGDQLHNTDSSHTGLDDTYSNTNGVTTYLIAGSGQPTMGEIYNYISTTSGELKENAIPTNGDGTVPLLSASLGQTSNVYYVDSDHMGLASNSASLTMAVNLLNGNTATISGIQTTPFQFSGTIMSVHSPTVLNVYDDGDNHTGTTSAGLIEENIPGSIYDQLGSAKFIYVPSGGNYHLATEATGTGSFDLKVTTYSNSTPTQELIYQNVPQTTNTTSSMSLSDNNTTLSLDVNGDGTNVHSISPTYTLTGSDVLDIAPPFTRAALSPTPNTDGKYPDPTTVNLTASASAGFSIDHTYYTVDGGSQQTYSAPFTVSNAGSHTITYWSVDSAGLTESTNTKSFTIASYNDDVINDGAIGYWTLSSASSSASGLTDLTSTANNMSAIDVTHGATKINSSASYSDSFNGTSSATYASSIGQTLYTARQNFSIEAWVKPTSIPSLYNYATFAGKNGSYWLFLDGPHLSFDLRKGGANNACDDAATATANTIYHLVGTYNGSTMKLYVNGSLACSQTISGDVDMNSGAVVTGSWDTSTLFLQGYLSNVAIYNSVLSSTQVSTHYNDGKL